MISLECMLQLRRMCFFFLVVETELAICLSAGAWRTGCTGTGAGGPSSAASLKRPPQGTGWLAACKLVVGWLGSRAGGPTAFQPRLTPARTLLPWRRGAPSVPPGTACILGAAHPADVVLPAPRHPSPPIDLVTVPCFSQHHENWALAVQSHESFSGEGGSHPEAAFCNQSPKVVRAQAVKGCLHRWSNFFFVYCCA